MLQFVSVSELTIIFTHIMDVGDPCFAKVKGWIPYPARIDGILSIKSSRKKKYQVTFYETDERNTVTHENIWPVSSDTVRKFVTEKTLSRRYFKDAWSKLQENHVLELSRNKMESDGMKQSAFIEVSEEKGPPHVSTISSEDIESCDDDEFSMEDLHIPVTMEKFVSRRLNVRSVSPSPESSVRSIDPNYEAVANRSGVNVENVEGEHNDQHIDLGCSISSGAMGRKKAPRNKASKSAGMKK